MVPPEEIQLIEIPLKKSHLSLNLSDESYETMGDRIGDTMDEKHEKIFTGKEAIERLMEIQNGNHTTRT